MLKELNEAGKEAGLVVNLDKTVLMAISEKDELCLGNEKLNWVEETVYLGQLISFEGRQRQEKNRRIKIAWSKFWSYKYIFKSNMSIRLKTKVLENLHHSITDIWVPNLAT